ncbi:MAG: hypothetical protein JW749_02245 [Sedimentisphaerales bacterium]|nr:hypothetical protein [Sedimentisphaerales bacterium]
MKDICYLCGKLIQHEELSDDHVVPKQIIKRKQPKTKGFDYAGVLPSHEKCNNQFGPEKCCQKAMKLIEVLHDDNCFLKRQHRDNPNINILAINSACLSDFSRQDLKYFKFIDVRNKGLSEWSTLSFFTDKTKTDPIRQSLFVSFSVLAKSAAALLISRRLKNIPKQWRIIAIPYYGKGNTFDLDDIAGNTKPFDIGVKVWLYPANNGNWWITYKACDIVVFMFFWLSGISSDIEEIVPFRPSAQCFEFQSTCLIDLIDYQWKQI